MTPAAKLKAVANLCDEHQVSQRRDEMGFEPSGRQKNFCNFTRPEMALCVAEFLSILPNLIEPITHRRHCSGRNPVTWPSSITSRSWATACMDVVPLAIIPVGRAVGNSPYWCAALTGRGPNHNDATPVTIFLLCADSTGRQRASKPIDIYQRRRSPWIV